MTKREMWEKLITDGRLTGGMITTYESGEKYEGTISEAISDDHGVTLKITGLTCRGRDGKIEKIGELTFHYDWGTLYSSNICSSSVYFNAYMLGDVHIRLN